MKEKERPTKFITDGNGVLLVDEKEVMSRWMRYFKALSSEKAEKDIIAEDGAQVKEPNKIIDRQEMLGSIVR